MVPFTPQITRLGVGVYSVETASGPVGSSYLVHVSSRSECGFTCTCGDFLYRVSPGKKRSCKHIDAVGAMLMANIGSRRPLAMPPMMVPVSGDPRSVYFVGTRDIFDPHPGDPPIIDWNRYDWMTCPTGKEWLAPALPADF